MTSEISDIAETLDNELGEGQGAGRARAGGTQGKA